MVLRKFYHDLDAARRSMHTRPTLHTSEEGREGSIDRKPRAHKSCSLSVGLLDLAVLNGLIELPSAKI